MRFFVLLAGLLVLALADREDWENFSEHLNQHNNINVIDFVHNFRFEDHEQQNGVHLMVVISDISGDQTCHLIEVSNSFEFYLTDPTLLHQLTEEVFHLIESGMAQETDMTRQELRDTYGDTDALRECVNHSVYVLQYIPSFTTPAPATTTAS